MGNDNSKLDEVWPDWRQAINMTASELEQWLKTEESKSVGQSEGDESVGHKSGRRIAAILRSHKADLSDEDVEHMRKVVGYVHRHLAQQPLSDIEHSPWRYSLMN